MAHPMRRFVFPSFLLVASLGPACAVVSRSPALGPPLRDHLAKADTSTIEDASRTCLNEGGYKPDDVTGDAEGANVVSAKNSEKVRVSVYIQARGTTPRVTGDPPYDDPFWKCLDRELGGSGSKPAPAPSAKPANPDEP